MLLAQLCHQEIPNALQFGENADSTTSKKTFLTVKPRRLYIKFKNLANKVEGCGICCLQKMNPNPSLLSILAIPFQRYCYSPEQMAICWWKSPSSSMHVVEASESSFSDSAGVLREAGSWLLGEIPARGNQWVKAAGRDVLLLFSSGWRQWYKSISPRGMCNIDDTCICIQETRCCDRFYTSSSNPDFCEYNGGRLQGIITAHLKQFHQFLFYAFHLKTFWQETWRNVQKLT